MKKEENRLIEMNGWMFENRKGNVKGYKSFVPEPPPSSVDSDSVIGD